MPIILDQYRMRELGRIRMGAKDGRGFPTKLKTWRLTSASRELLEAVAETYGGEVSVWEDAPNDGEHFEIVTTSDVLNILVPPGDAAFSQWMEMWAGGGCKRRCDGVTQVLRDVACACPKDPDERREKAKNGQACKETTRFNVMLPDIPDIGVWRLETHGYYAAVELAGFQQLIAVASSSGAMIRARLRIDHRTAKKAAEGGKSETFRYTVPVVEISHTVGDVLQAMGASADDIAVQLPAPVQRRSLPDGRPELPAQAQGWGDQEPSRTEAPLDSGATGAERQTEGATEPPSDWLRNLRTRFSDDLIIKVAEQVRFELRGEGTPITTIEGVQTAENIGAHTTIVDRLTNQGRRNVGTDDAGASQGEAEEVERTAPSEAEPTPSQPELGGGGGTGSPTSPAVPSESNGTRARYVALISNAVEGNISLGQGRARASETYVLQRATSIATKESLTIPGSFDDVLENADESLLKALVDAWDLEEKLGATV